MTIFTATMRGLGLWVAAAWIAAAFPATTTAKASGDLFIENARQLTFDGRRSGESYFSPDGNALIFQSERDPDNPFYQIFMLDLTSGDTHRVSPGHGKTTCAFFRPGTNEVLFASTHLDPDARAKQKAELDFRASGKERRYAWDYDESFDIFVTQRDGSQTQRLTDANGYDAEGAYSPDGSKIVFCSMRNAYPASNLSSEDAKRLEYDPSYFGEIYLMDADGSNQTRLTNWPGYDGGPFFSPDGERIVWRHFGEKGTVADVYTMKLDGSDRRQLTDFASMSWAPYFHPSGEYVVFTTNKHGFENFEVFIVDAMGTREPVRVTYTDGFDGLPVFSPDGKKLVWTSTRSGGMSQVYLGNWNHRAALNALAEAPERGTVQKEAATHGAGSGGGSTSVEISADDLRHHASILASDKMEGRMTGTKGEKAAAKYLAESLEQMGVAPLSGKSYIQEFPFTSGVKVDKANCGLQVSVAGKNVKYAVEQDFRPLAFSENGEFSGDVVFAGYGLRVPGDAGESYNSYDGLDVKDKVVMVLRYVPEDVSTERRQALNRYAGLRYKAMIARENGAKALLVVTGPTSPNAGKLVGLSFDQSLASSGIGVASITTNVANTLLANHDKSLEEIQKELDRENPHFLGHFPIPDASLQLATAVKRETKQGRNVVGVIPPADANGDYVVIGAHYDHIGYGEIGSLAKSGEEGKIHNGADDNASGTAVVLELAQQLSEMRKDTTAFQRGVIVAFWSGEELGIIGSNYFVANPTMATTKGADQDRERIAAYLNFDMVGRLRDNKLKIQGIGSSSVWKGIFEHKNVVAGFDLQLGEDPYLPTDVTAFYPKGIPVASFFTGSHEDYNRPTDDADRLDYEGMERIGKLALGVITELTKTADQLDYVKVEPTKSQQSGGRGGLRAYTGTIPDYAGDDVEGLLLSGVRAGGPAEKAGLQAGDIIVKFGGQDIKNIYDYTYALDAVKVGKPLEVVVMRDGKRMEFTMIPEARK